VFARVLSTNANKKLDINHITELPIELRNLKNLKSLILYSNRLSGNIPLWLGEIPNVYMNFRANRFTGSIPSTLLNQSDAFDDYLKE
jgi:hypothetical protein